MIHLGPARVPLHREDALALLNPFASYFNGQRDTPWQWDRVRRNSCQPVVD